MNKLMAQQTALEWFWLHLEDNISKKYFDLFQQAKEMEKEQIENIFDDGYAMKYIHGEQYYKKTYGDK
jgi:hypothetical protein